MKIKSVIALSLVMWNLSTAEDLKKKVLSEGLSIETIDGKISYKLYEDQVLYVRKGKSHALLKFVFHEESAKYSYKFREGNNELILGNGILAEKYIEVKKDGNILLQDNGSILVVECDNIKFEWSCSSNQSGFFYFSVKDDFEVIIFDLDYYEKSNLGNLLDKN